MFITKKTKDYGKMEVLNGLNVTGLLFVPTTDDVIIVLITDKSLNIDRNLVHYKGQGITKWQKKKYIILCLV